MKWKKEKPKKIFGMKTIVLESFEHFKNITEKDRIVANTLAMELLGEKIIFDKETVNFENHAIRFYHTSKN